MDEREQLQRGDYTLENYWYSGRLPGQSATLFYRNVFKEENLRWIYKAHDMMADKSLMLIALLYGNIYRMQGKMSARRLVRKKGAENWNSILLELDADCEQMKLIIYQLRWFEKRTKNYSMTSNKWKNLLTYFVRYMVKAHCCNRSDKRFVLCLRILMGTINNYIMRNTLKNVKI